nr:restriction endonuclease subunit S [Oceanobacillus massiliensis]
MTKEMKDSGVDWLGEIPTDWVVSKIGSHYINRNEKVSDLDYEPLSVTKNGIVPQLDSAAKSSNHNNRKLVLKDDFVINSRSDRKMSSGIAYSDGSVSVINTVIHSDTISKEYTKYLLKNYSFAEEFYKWGTGIVADLWSTRWEKMKNIPIPVPNIVEQENIAAKIDKFSDNIKNVINETRQSIEELKKYKQSIITESVTKGLNSNVEMKDSGIEVIGKIKRNYSVIPLGYLGSLQNGISKSGDHFGEGYPFVSYSDVYNNRVLPSTVQGLVKSTVNEQEYYSIQKGDVLFTRTSETIEEVGMASVCFSDIEHATFAGFLIRLRPNEESEFSSQYARYYLEATFIRDFFAKEMNLVTRASLSQPLLKKLPIILPSVDEQQEIVSYLDEQTNRIDKLISDKEKVIKDLEQYKKSLVYEYVTGKKEV